MGSTKYTIEDCTKIANEKNIKFLSTEFFDASTKYMWQCDVPEHPPFSKSLTQINQGQGCPKCRYIKVAKKLRGKNQKTGQVVDEEFIINFVKGKGGEILDMNYENEKSKIQIKCKNEHVFASTWDSLYHQNTWCGRCAHLVRTLEDCRNEAAKWGGECLSTEYINSTTNLRWKCNNGHIFEKTPELVHAGCWCPDCTSSVGERLTRGLFAKIFGKDFPKVRPNSLVNIENNRLELDGYNASLRLGFEYQGLQHYKLIGHFQKNAESLEKRIRDDRIKVKWCKANNITLVVIPEFEDVSNLDAVINKVEAAITSAGITIPDYVRPTTHGEILSSDISALQELCKKKGGRCISDAFLGWNAIHTYECGKGHRWSTTAGAIKSGTWCPQCSMKEMGIRKRKYTLEDAKKLIEHRNGKLVSANESFCADEDLIWYCAIHDYTWTAPYNRIKKGSWCPICGKEASIKNRKKYTIKTLQNLAAEHGGKCLSEKYIACDTRYHWECVNGHRWWATYNDIKGSPSHKPTWCPYCSKKKRHTLEEMQAYAETKGGKCLSTEYKNAKTMMDWECSCGKRFRESWTNIQGNRWCRKGCPDGKYSPGRR